MSGSKPRFIMSSRPMSVANEAIPKTSFSLRIRNFSARASERAPAPFSGTWSLSAFNSISAKYVRMYYWPENKTGPSSSPRPLLNTAYAD